MASKPAKGKPKRPALRARAKKPVKRSAKKPAPPKGWRGCGRTKDTIARLEKCLELLKVHGVINVACRQSIVAGRALSKQTYYEMRQQHPDFVEESDEAIAQSIEELEASGMACARMAQRDPRYLPMLKFALQVKAKWRESQHLEVTGKDDGPIRHAGELTVKLVNGDGTPLLPDGNE